MRRLGKKSLVAGILAMGFLLAGTGYAYWTDTLNVTTKATTGDFGVTFADLGLYAQYGNEIGKPGSWSIVDGVGNDGYVSNHFFRRDGAYNKIAKEGSIEEYKERAKGYHNIEFDAKLNDAKPIPKNIGSYTTANTNGSDKIILDIHKMYPGYAQAFRTDILNVGDIAAKLSNLKFNIKDFTGTEQGNIKDMLGVAVLIEGEHRPNGPEAYNVFGLAKLAKAEDVFKVGGVEFVRLSALEKLNIKDGLIEEDATILCTPTANRMDLFLGVAMDPDMEGKYTTGSSKDLKDNDDTQSQKKGVQVEIDLLWDQFNVGKPANAIPNILENQN